MFASSNDDPFEVPGASDAVVRVEWPEDDAAPGEWVGLILYSDGAAPISPADLEYTPDSDADPTSYAERVRRERAEARRELLEVSALARVGSASSEGAAWLSAYAAVDPETRVGYVEVWIDDQEQPLRSGPVANVVTLRALLSRELADANQEAADLMGSDEMDFEPSFSVPKEMPPRRRSAKGSAKGKAKSASRRGKQAATKLTRGQAKRMVRELMARGTLATESDPIDSEAVVKLAKQLRRGGYAPRLDTRCYDYDIGGYLVSCQAERRLYFGKLLAAQWEFDLCGEAGLHITGLMLDTSSEQPALDEELIADIGLKFDEYGDFPCDWDEARERCGMLEEEDEY